MTPPVCDSNSFTDYTGTLHVPASALEAYRTAPYWKNFSNIIGDAAQLGDVNSDGLVNISDVSSLINYLLSDDATGINTANGDMNNNGEVNITDVIDFINMLLNSAN